MYINAFKSDVSQLQLKAAKNLEHFDKVLLMKLSAMYGKVASRKYLQSLI